MIVDNFSCTNLQSLRWRSIATAFACVNSEMCSFSLRRAKCTHTRSHLLYYMRFCSFKHVTIIANKNQCTNAIFKFHTIWWKWTLALHLFNGAMGFRPIWKIFQCRYFEKWFKIIAKFEMKNRQNTSKTFKGSCQN